MKLSGLLDKYNTISIIGMCKNAGKTTVLNKLIDEYRDKKILAMTSVGRDGESTDVVTITPKPEIFAPSGTIVATAKNLLRYCSATVEILANTGIPTPLGEVVVFRALSDGYVQIAGPSITEQLVELKKIFSRFGAQKIFIDGAISRRSLCSTVVSDATVLSTGASYSPEMTAVVEDTAYMAKILSLPMTDYVFQKTDKPFSVIRNGEKSGYDGRIIDAFGDKPSAVLINGGLIDNLVKPLLTKNLDIDGVTLATTDSSKIFLSKKIYNMLILRGALLRVINNVNLVAVTVNPVSAYGNLFDADEFLAKMSSATSLPVFDVKNDNNI